MNMLHKVAKLPADCVLLEDRESIWLQLLIALLRTAQLHVLLIVCC